MMSTSIIKPIIVGIIIGAALFFMPFFVLRVAITAIIIGLIFKSFRRSGFGRGFDRKQRFSHMADKIRNMSDEEYKQFKEKFSYCRSNYQTDKVPVN